MTAVLGRQGELGEIERFLDGVAGEGSRLVLLSGQAGIGKTTLWNAGIQSANDHGYRVVTARPTEVETGLAFAALGDLLGPLLDLPMPDLPAPQREALDAALLRVSAASPPQPLGVSLAALNVLRTAAAEEPSSWPSTTSRGSTRRRRACSTSRSAASTATVSGSSGAPCGDDARAASGLARVDPAGPAHPPRPWAPLHGPDRRAAAVAAGSQPVTGGPQAAALDLRRYAVLRPRARSRAAAPRRLVDARDARGARSLDGLIDARLAALDPAADETALYAAALAQATVPVLVAATGEERTQAGLGAPRPPA